LDTIISIIARKRPELAQKIRQNPVAFLHQAGLNAEMGPSGVLVDLPRQQAQPEGRYSPEERAEIQRLADLGFDFEAAARAWEVSNRNHDLAANLLLNLD
jgi:hypothetical protein